MKEDLGNNVISTSKDSNSRPHTQGPIQFQIDVDTNVEVNVAIQHPLETPTLVPNLSSATCGKKNRMMIRMTRLIQLI